MSKYFAFLAAFFAPIQATAAGLLFFVVVRVCTELWAWHKDGVATTPAKQVVRNVFLYATGLALAHVGQTYVVPGLPMLSVVAGLIIVLELQLINSNYKRIAGFTLFEAFAKQQTNWNAQITGSSQEVTVVLHPEPAEQPLGLSEPNGSAIPEQP